MSRGTQLERLAVLETQVSAILNTVGKIDRTQDEIRDTLTEVRGAAKGGLSLLRLAYPPIASAIAAAGAIYGLPRVVVLLGALLLAPSAIADGNKAPPPEAVRFCPDVEEIIVRTLPASRELTGHDRQALWVPCIDLPHQDDA